MLILNGNLLLTFGRQLKYFELVISKPRILASIEVSGNLLLRYVKYYGPLFEHQL